ncbi:hypothetical protein AAFF_G00394390 [Aldrovandia affinis]|uniref:Uncharacterized protein n=1 Tax=Aldrovandia affinis TaxID=143900 RepID=A0AAD7SDN7_9TELE|nr:hypothetical protein AAFF_G00394390 [Aldrovandia affinis]
MFQRLAAFVATECFSALGSATMQQKPDPWHSQGVKCIIDESWVDPGGAGGETLHLSGEIARFSNRNRTGGAQQPDHLAGVHTLQFFTSASTGYGVRRNTLLAERKEFRGRDTPPVIWPGVTFSVGQAAAEPRASVAVSPKKTNK